MSLPPERTTKSEQIVTRLRAYRNSIGCMSPRIAVPLTGSSIPSGRQRGSLAANRPAAFPIREHATAQAYISSILMFGPDVCFPAKVSVGELAFAVDQYARANPHLYSWRRLGTAIGADHRAVQRWHADEIRCIARGMRAAG